MQVVMTLIMQGGNAKGQAFQAIQAAKAGNFESAEALLKSSNDELIAAHKTQTELLTAEANGEHVELDLYMVHAQDHLMNAISFRDLAVEFVGQERRLQKLEKKG